jgi:energy-coupling factor transporter transmembrane protein EcfT
VDVSAIDRSATRGDGPLRNAAPSSKLVMLAILIAAVLVSWNILILTALLIALLALLVWGRIPLGLALSLAGYPAVFALIFAFSSAPNVLSAAVIVGKAVTAALAAVTIVLSTPYPQTFAPLQRVTPAIVGDALLMTYRALFILLEKFANLLRAIRLRAGIRNGQPLRSARATAAALGGLLLYSMDLAQRDHDIMRVRGYEGRLRVAPAKSADRRVDVLLVVTASALLCVSIIWRLGAAQLNPYSWMPVLPSLFLLVTASMTRRPSS